MTEREVFEAWAKDNFLDVHRATDGGYFDALTSTTWFAWQACAARQVAQRCEAQGASTVNAEGTPASSEPDEQNPVSRSSLPNRSVLPRE